MKRAFTKHAQKRDNLIMRVPREGARTMRKSNGSRMKNRLFPIFFSLLLFLSSNLFAQPNNGLFNLKEGDWFEVQVEQNYRTSFSLSGKLPEQLNEKKFLLNYQLQKQLPNGNQQYSIRLDHFKIKKKYGEKYFGYDSFYPSFEENKANPEPKQQFTLEVSPFGKIVTLTAFKGNKNRIVNLSEIGSSYLYKNTISYSESNSDSLLIGIFSSNLMLLDSLPSQTITTESGIPQLIRRSGMKITVIDASFPLKNNTLVKGVLYDCINTEITIRMLGANAAYYFPENQIQTQKDGSFNCPIFLKRPLHLRIQVGEKTLTTFMEPGDTLNISDIGHQSREIQYNQYAETKPNEYYSPDRNKTSGFSGTAAYNTMLSNELDQYRNGYFRNNDLNSVVKNERKNKEAVTQLIESYKGKASDECIKYFELDFNYFFAVAKLYFNESLLSSNYEDRSSAKFEKVNYPTDFFLEVDTMPVLMNPFEWNTSYQNFIERSGVYKQKRLGWSVGAYFTDNFPDSYYFLKASLKGHPLYAQLAKVLELELKKGQTEIDRVTPYYQDFIINCADPALNESLMRVFETAELLKIGTEFPIKHFVLQDSSIFNLEKFKGKSICIVLFDGSKTKLNKFKENIEKFSSEEVEFVFVRPIGKIWIEGKEDRTIWEKPNVSYLELPEAYLNSNFLLERTKIFMLDKWFRIVENNAEDPMTHSYKGGNSEFEKSLRKTIEAKRYSKTEKTALIRIAGWSFGSILFTILFGWWVYKIRIRRIKEQEAAKRRIKELEIKAIRSQMNPHFIFNALNSIQSLINGNQFKEANIYLSKFAVLLRGVLNNSEKNRISLSDELQAVALYCQLEQLRFEFKFEIHIATEVNADLIEIPGMIIQPLAENAIVHGLTGKGNQGELSIQIKLQNGNLCVCVLDNGVGLETVKIDALSQKGFGLKLVEERINILNLEAKEAKLTVENRNNTNGTIATLIIPID